MGIRHFLFIGLLVFSASAKSQSLLWQIDGSALSEPSYLFGTLHIGSQKAIDFDSTVIEKINDCNAFAMELDPDSYESYDLFQLLQLPDSLKAVNLLDSQQNSILDSAFASLGQGNMESLRGFYPIALSTFFTQNPEQKVDAVQVSVDVYLRQRAQWNGLDVYSLETLEEQAHVLRAIPIRKQYDELLAVVQGSLGEEDLFLLENLYLKQELSALYTYTLKHSEWKNGMDSVLLDRRNELMVERMQDIMANQSTFTAVGAAHLPGKNGLIELLRKEGYRLTPIKFEFTK